MVTTKPPPPPPQKKNLCITMNALCNIATQKITWQTTWEQNNENCKYRQFKQNQRKVKLICFKQYSEECRMSPTHTSNCSDNQNITVLMSMISCQLQGLVHIKKHQNQYFMKIWNMGNWIYTYTFTKLSVPTPKLKKKK